MAMRLAILASGAGTTAQAVIDACAAGRIDGSVVLVVSNNADAAVLERARCAGVAWRHISAAGEGSEESVDDALLAAARASGATHVLLAGYLKRVGPALLAAFEGRIYNTHPALLPAFGGAGMYGDRVHAAVLASAATRSGATVHIVTEDYDSGPIVGSVEVAVLSDDDVVSLGERVRAAERELVVDVLAAAALD